MKNQNTSTNAVFTALSDHELTYINGGDGKTVWDCIYAFGKGCYDWGYTVGKYIKRKLGF